MKKLFLIFTLALALIAAASCGTSLQIAGWTRAGMDDHDKDVLACMKTATDAAGQMPSSDGLALLHWCQARDDAFALCMRGKGYSIR